MNKPSLHDLMRAAVGLGFITPNIERQPVYVAHKHLPHRKEVEMNLLRVLAALNDVALQNGYVITAERKVTLLPTAPRNPQTGEQPVFLSRSTDLDVRENRHEELV
jgi:hypothetical protein